MRIDTFTALSLNGIIGEKRGSSRIFTKLSSKKILKFRKKIRNQYNAILIGVNTLKRDNPILLNSKLSNYRLVIDKYYNLSLNLKIFKNRPENTIIVLRKKKKYIHYFNGIKKTGAKLLFLNNYNLYNFKKKLKKFGIRSILIEGGAKTITEFLKNDFIDNIQLIIFPIFLNSEAINIFSGQDPFKKFKLILFKIIDKNYIFIKLKILQKLTRYKSKPLL